ncbi:MAG: hypothetical protein KAT71_05180 [Gammaproteobacteria bacterium]|nr:hypothetical protein [Gammaproteobacteria bacterium]
MKYKKIFLNICLLVIIFVCQTANAKQFILTAIYSPDKQLHSCMNVLQSVINQANNNGLNIKLVKLINKDDSSIGALQLAKEAKNIHSDAVIGGGSSEQMLLESRVLNSADIPVFVLTAEHPDISVDKPYVVTLLPSLKVFCNSAANRIMNISPKAKKILIVRNISMQYAIYVSDAVTKITKKERPNTKIEYINIINGYGFINSLAEKIKQNRPDMVYLPIYNKQIASLLIELTKQHPFPIDIFINAGPSVINEMKYYRLILRDHPEIKLHIFTVWSGKPSGKYSLLYKSLLNKNESASDLKVALTFDAVELLINALKENSSIRGMNLVYLVKLEKFPGVTGDIWFDKFGNTVKRKKDRFFYYVI